MAGDVYDRSVSPAAVELLDDAFYELVVEVDTPVIAIVGNHDSPDRLDCGARILSAQGLHVFSTLRPEPGIVSLEEETEALSDLRGTGRLVGIIAHVSELKHRVAPLEGRG